MRMQTLSEVQRGRVEELAMEKGITCRSCGAEILESGERTRPLLGGTLGVDLLCPNHLGGLDGRRELPLSDQDARRVFGG